MPEDTGQRLIVGVDIGGSKVAVALATAEGQILGREYTPTSAEAKPDAVVNGICVGIDKIVSIAGIEPTDLCGIGIAAAGIIDSDRGTVITSPNLPGWHEVPLRDAIQERFNIPVYLGNDASLAALGEWWFGLKKRVANVIYITVSTGIGGGIVADGKLYTGACGVAGEIGHMTIDVNGPRCNCGNIGCWEALASGTALARQAIGQIKKGAKTSIAELVDGDLTRIDAKVVFEAAREEDELAKKLISRLAYYFGVGLANLVNIFSPELILIGGGVAKMGDLLLQPAIEVVKERAYVTLAYDVEIKPALLGDDSGVLGAVAFVLEHTG